MNFLKQCISKCLIIALAAAVVLPQTAFGALDKNKYPHGETDLSYSGSTCGSPAMIAYEKGFFDEEGVKVTLVSGVSFEAQRTALATGKLAVVNGDFQFFPAIYNGIDVKLISGLHEGCIKLLVLKSSPIKSLKDLKGRKLRIAVDEIGGTPMSVASVVLGEQGINPQDTNAVVWKPYPSDQIMTAAEKGEVDIIAAWDPRATEAEQSGKYRTLIDIGKDAPFAGKYCCFLFASGKVVKNNPDKVAAILRAYDKATKWIGEHPDEAAQILVSKKYVPTDNVKLVATLLKSYHYNNLHGSHNAQSQEKTQQAKNDAIFFAKEMIKTGYLPTTLDAAKFIDGIYVDIFAVESAFNAKKK
ncbi:MAG: ABC transporter substrate-binding protein [Elusimicrobiota bacterium]|jgi:NitT/TauT family transport system substrate-binding protein|nr:ABC transporter substrate-binding protein [Elusimicrobiota bacterium]